MPEKIYTLGKKEIIRGFRRFEDILASGKRLENGYLSAYIEQSIPVLDDTRSDKQDIPVKIGFILSKKKLKKHTIGTE